MNTKQFIFVCLLITALLFSFTEARGRRAPARSAPARRAAPPPRRAAPPRRTVAPPRPVWRAPPRVTPRPIPRPRVVARPAPPRQQFVTRNVCTRSCSTQRNCTRGGCAKFSTKTKQICVRNGQLRSCARYNTSKEKVCVKGKTKCVGWDTVAQKSCKRYRRVRIPIMKQANGKCLKSKKVCAHYQTRRIPKCVEYGTKCAKFQATTGKVCTKYSKASSKRECAQWKNVTTKWCKGTVKKCAQYKNVTSSYCKKTAKVCSKYVTAGVTVPRRVCTKQQNVCARNTTYKYKMCAKYATTNKCQHYGERSVRKCVARKPVCLKSVNVKHRVCARGSRKCTKYVTQKLGDKCVAWKQNTVTKRVCAVYGKRRVAASRKCLKWSKPRCLAFKKVTRVFKGKKRTVRRCALRSAKGTRVAGGCRVFRQRNGKIIKRCPRAVFACKVLSTKNGVTRVCCSKKIRSVRRGKRRCLKWRATKAKTVRVCKKHVVKKIRAMVCKKRVARTKKICARWTGVCKKYTFKIRKQCTKYGGKCTKFKTEKTRFCRQYHRKCVKFIQRTGRKCAQWKKKCVAYRLTKYTKKYKKCAAFANKCTSVGFKHKRECTKFTKACARSGSTTRRVCVRYRTTNTPRKCLKWNTWKKLKCVKNQRYCKRSVNQYARTCTRHAHSCQAYEKVMKPVGYKTQEICADWVVKKVPLRCNRWAKAGCEKFVTRVTGKHCAKWQTKTTCLEKKTQTSTVCARTVPPRCTNRQVCRNTCRSVRVRARADVHLIVGGKWVDFNFAGVFDYFTHGPCTAQIRLERIKYGSVITGAAVKCNNHIFEATPEGVFLNGEAVSANAKFGENGSVSSLNGNQKVWRLVTGFGLNVRVRLNPSLNVISLSFHSTKESNEKFSDTGLFRKGSVEFAKEYVVPEKESLFKRYVPYQKIPKRVSVSEKERKQAEAVCAKNLKRGTDAFKQCAFDYLATGVDFSKAYLDDQKMKN